MKSSSVPNDDGINRPVVSPDGSTEPFLCVKCKHYEALERALNESNKPLSPTAKRIKWTIYWFFWIVIISLTFAVSQRKRFCKFLDWFETDLN